MSSVCSDLEEGTIHVCVALAHAGLETSFCPAPLGLVMVWGQA